ncbi:MAG: bifunctional oligoribonuclease/PAP phosphatase NrnA [bacterium]
MIPVNKEQKKTMLAIFDDISSIIEKSQKVLVVSHIDPDGDALGTQLAFAAYLRSLKKDVYLVKESDLPEKYKFLPDVDLISNIEDYNHDLGIDTVIILECPGFDRLGKAHTLFGDKVSIINIDHHRDSIMLGDVNWIDPTRSSVGEMVFEYFEASGFNLNKNIATQLYTAILTDTGRFRYNATSPRTMEIVGRLIAAGADPKYICDEVYYNLSQSTMMLTAKVLHSIEYHCDGRICLLTLTKNMLEDSGADMSESDGLVDFTLFTEGVIVGALIKESDQNITKISMRSRDGINVAEIAAKFGGGGHFNAAGCTIEKNLESAKEVILKNLKEELNDPSC